MKGFDSRHTLTCILERPGAGALTFKLGAPVPGWMARLQTLYPPPQRYEAQGGKAPQPVGIDAERLPLYQHRKVMLMIGKALHEGGEEVGYPAEEPTDRRGWDELAQRLDEEFAAANLTEGEVTELAKAAAEAIHGKPLAGAQREGNA